MLTGTYRVNIRCSLSGRAWVRGLKMSFLVGLVLFVGVCGFLDARLPWTSRNRRSSR
jgi:hypothetical protein